MGVKEDSEPLLTSALLLGLWMRAARLVASHCAIPSGGGRSVVDIQGVKFAMFNTTFQMPYAHALILT
jgi:hypothetical protein